MSLLSKFIVPDGFGYVVLVGLGHHFFNMYLAVKVMQARKKFSIEYPIMYHPENTVFNCIQRAHQNTLEAYPSVLFMLCFSGLQYPKISAGAGVVYLVCRFFYARGYSTGDPEKRRYGAILMHIPELVLFGGAVSWAWHQLGWRPCASDWKRITSFFFTTQSPCRQ